MLKFLKNKFKGKEENELVKIIDTLRKEKNFLIYNANELSDLPTFKLIQKSTPEEKKAITVALSEVITDCSLKRLKTQHGRSGQLRKTAQLYHERKIAACSLQSRLLKSNLNYNPIEWIELMSSFRKSIDAMPPENDYLPLNEFPVNAAIKQIEFFLKKNEMTENLSNYIQEVLEWKDINNDKKIYYYGFDLTKTPLRLRKLLGDSVSTPLFSLKTNDIGPEINKTLSTISQNRELFDQIFALAEGVSGGKPNKKFTSATTALLDKIGTANYRKVLHQILEVPVKYPITTSTSTSEWMGQMHTTTSGSYICGPSQNFIKGIVWTADRFSDKETIRLLSRLTEKSYTKIPNKGPAAASLGNACVYVLGNMRGKDGLGALSRLKLKVRQNNVKKTIDKYLTIGAKKYNVSVEELKEMAVPDFHLKDGHKVIEFDDYQLTITLSGVKAIQQWLKPDGSPMKSVPSKVKNSDALKKKLAAFRKEVKEIQKVYSAQKQRIDNQFILDRTWDYPSFSKFYLNHGLVAPITKKLIWTFTNGQKSENAIFINGQWTSVKDDVLDWVNEETKVKLWHPIHAEQSAIVDWREKIITLEWKQPIKQAFREIYILTDAEINTRMYSNRMAAHILKQHQFNVLANLRNWKYALMGWYDDGRDNEICHKYLPKYKMTAEFWIDEIAQDDAYNDAGIWLYIATDQVKFKDENDEPIELIHVPKIVLTEILRDVDMFVGVCSVGNDPQWMDNNGARQENRHYWESYSFGDLTEIAKTRKTILERLLPRLTKIRDKAHIDGKFLIVKGNLRTYKIHIGSGNILMEPNDQYLCIVQQRGASKSTDKIFIPFEGDKGLSMVLSKAFLLVADDKISDSTIMSQING